MTPALFLLIRIIAQQKTFSEVGSINFGINGKRNRIFSLRPSFFVDLSSISKLNLHRKAARVDAKNAFKVRRPIDFSPLPS